MKLAYLTNQYPRVSHSFIRREILALEAHGLKITRFSIRRAREELPDARDRREAEQTTFLLEQGGGALFVCLVQTALAHPGAFARALQLAYRMGRGSQRGLPRHFMYLVEACMLRFLCAAQGITHLHVHHATNPAAVALLCRALGGPMYSLSVHGPEEFEHAEQLALPAKLASAAFIVAVSEYGRRELAKWCDESTRARIHIVHCGVDDVFLNTSAPRVPDVGHLLWVGRMEEQKDPLLLVDAIAQVRAQNIKCTVTMIGDGSMRPAVMQAIRRAQLEEVITLAGWAGGEKIIAELVASRALLLSSRAENIPSVLMEALAMRRPVVSTEVGGIAELVLHGESGWLVPYGSSDAFATAVRLVLETDAARLDEMGHVGKQIVQAYFSVRQQAAVLLDLLNRTDRLS